MKGDWDTDAWSCCANSSFSWGKPFPPTGSVLNKISSFVSVTDLFLTKLYVFVLRHLWNFTTYIFHALSNVFSEMILSCLSFWPSFSAAYSSRTRRILREAHEEGRPCPSQLTQTKPCPIRPCYRWLISDWSPCTLEVRQFIHLLRWAERKTWSLSKTPSTQSLTLQRYDLDSA